MIPKKKTKCMMCDEDFTYYGMSQSAMDVKNIPSVCNKKVCLTNFKYRERMRNPITGEKPDPEKVRKV